MSARKQILAEAIRLDITLDRLRYRRRFLPGWSADCENRQFVGIRAADVIAAMKKYAAERDEK